MDIRGFLSVPSYNVIGYPLCEMFLILRRLILGKKNPPIDEEDLPRLTCDGDSPSSHLSTGPISLRSVATVTNGGAG
jgi:hypothetical protein